uniref:SET domain-containing protein n=1 Tax=Eutreptiella gymnastica TaxID=73025 RepID=A0A7S1NGF4_9EUGL|mmetsp:Transcript_3181/g.5509  ORF Transcript_3181/g.5509 Transcript_3181/m.5509 type:complete len:574 (+) Transcript_3181:101-1822(+)
MSQLAHFVMLLFLGVHAAPIADTILNSIVTNCPLDTARPSPFCVAQIEALFAMEHLTRKRQPKDITLKLLKAVRDGYMDNQQLETALAASQQLAQLVPDDHILAAENKKYILWLEKASEPLSRGEAVLPKLHDCPTQKRCRQIINAALLHQQLRMEGGRVRTHPGFVGTLGMGLVTDQDVKPGELLLVVPKHFAFYRNDTDGFGEDVLWAADLDRVERFAVRILMAWKDPKWKRWKDCATSLWEGNTPEVLDVPATWTAEQLQILQHVNPYAAAWAKILTAGWKATFTQVAKSLSKIVPDEVLTLEHWLWACVYALTRSEVDMLLPYVELMNHSPDGEVTLKASNGDHYMNATRHYTKGEQVFYQYYWPPGELVYGLITWGVVWEDFLPTGAFAWFFGMVGNASPWDRLAEALEGHDWQWRLMEVGSDGGRLLRACRALYMEEEDMKHLDKLLLGEEISPHNELLAVREQWEQLSHVKQVLENATQMLEAAAPSPQLDTAQSLHRAQSVILHNALANAALRYTDLYWRARQQLNSTQHPYIPPCIVPTPSTKELEGWRQYRSRYVRTAISNLS